MAHIQYYKNILCFPANLYYHEYGNGSGKGEVIRENYISYSAYCQQVSRGTLNIVRPGKGEGNYALIELSTIPKKYRGRIEEDYPEPEKEAKERPFVEQIVKDEKAFAFFSSYRYSDGTNLNSHKTDNITRLGNAASILNTIALEYKEHASERAKGGKKPLNTVFFENMASIIRNSEAIERRYPHNLPLNSRRLREKFENYRASSYDGLIKRYHGMKNATKIDDNLLRLLSYIAGMPTRPYNSKVVEYYREFMEGRLELIDEKTGEMFMPADYLDDDGNIIEFTEEAVWYRLNQPGLQVRLDKKRLGFKDYNDTHRPHRHRHLPEFSFSKISLDDRDLIWKDRTTKKRVKAYYAYDVTSGCRVGSAYSDDKNEELFLDCLRDMFVFVERNGFGMPLEVEVEHHLVNKFFDDLKHMFPILTICAPSNSQEKRAEHFNRAVKYSVEKNNHPGVGRWWLKSKYNRISVDKVDDEFKQTMKDRDVMIVEDIQDTLEYNNQKHPNQKKYPGMTRMQVLRANINPDLPRLNKSLIYRYIGFETKDISIHRNQFLNVQYEKYMLPNPRVLELLRPNNRTVDAYWIPDENGSINEVYVYQNGEYICTCDKLIEYNEAKAERTEVDEAAKLKQDKYVAMFDKYVKDGVVDFPKLHVSKVNNDPVPEPEIIDIEQQPEPAKEQTAVNYAEKALSDFF